MLVTCVDKIMSKYESAHQIGRPQRVFTVDQTMTNIFFLSVTAKWKPDLKILFGDILVQRF